MDKYVFGGWYVRLIEAGLAILTAFVFYRIISNIITKSEERGANKFLISNKGRTYLRLGRSIFRYALIVVTVLAVLQILGIDVSSIIAGIGLVGVVLGLAIQDWLKDIIRGTSILSDTYFTVGDVVKYGSIEGVVLVIGLKSTKIRDLATGNIISIANRNIEEIQVVSDLIYVRIPMPYELPVSKAEHAIEEILERVRQIAGVKSCRYLGVTELADSSVQYLLEVSGDVQKKLQLRRDTLRAILLGLEQNEIEVPYQQIDVHAKQM